MKTPRSRWRKFLRWLLRGAAVLVVLIFVITALAYWRLSRGPISLAPLIPRAEKALDAVAAPNAITLDDFVLTWNGWRNPFDVKAIGVGFRGPDGEEIGQFNELGVDVFLPALLHGQIVPVSIELRGLRLSVTRKADGTLDIAFTGGTGSDAETSSKGDGDRWLEAWIGGKADGPLRRLDHFRISDAALTVMQSIPLNGVLLVTSPQDLAGMVVRKAARMAAQLKVPLVGLVENMSYLTCPQCGERIEVFGPSRAMETADRLGLSLLAQLPLDPDLARRCDAGQVEEYENEVFQSLAARVMERASAVKSTPIFAKG